jgi:hypothetical protein
MSVHYCKADELQRRQRRGYNCQSIWDGIPPILKEQVSAIRTSRWGKSLPFTMPQRGIVSSKTGGLRFVSDMVTCCSFAEAPKRRSCLQDK